MISPMAATIIHGIDDLKRRDGTHLGYSPWHVVTQQQIDRFALVRCSSDDVPRALFQLLDRSGSTSSNLRPGCLTYESTP